MTDYSPPLRDIRFAINELAGLDRVLACEAFADVDADTIEQVLTEAGRFASDVWAPLNVPGDRAGCRVENKSVVVADGFDDAYRQFVENGWQSISGNPEYGGMGLPEMVSAAAFETWQAANMAFSLCPLLTAGSIVAIEAHGTEDMKRTYLPRLISGEWSGTMVLTEPQAGSDLAAITTSAEPDGDRYRIRGTKIYITWGDHPLSENIVHLVLARLPDAPEGVRGISMFLVPKFLPNEDGSPGEPNDLYPASVEHKLGIHASPTCVMTFGDKDGAIGWLVGEENRGLANMFTMMNHARLEVGIQGLAITDRALQLAARHARDRVQGRAPGVEGRATIVNHPDVRRMLLTMKAYAEAMRASALYAAGLLDLRHCAGDEGEREAADTRAALLTPIVKGWLTEVAQEMTSLGVQVHGGMGFVEETGAAQYMRDARILPIYEGTTGIQANDLVGRKILGDEGRAIRTLIAEMRELDDALDNDDLHVIRDAHRAGVDELERAVDWLISNAAGDPNVPGSASVNLLMLAGTVIGGWHMARAAVRAGEAECVDRYGAAFCEAKVQTAKFYAAHIAPRAVALGRAATAGSDVLMEIAEDAF